MAITNTVKTATVDGGGQYLGISLREIIFAWPVKIFAQNTDTHEQIVTQSEDIFFLFRFLEINLRIKSPLNSHLFFGDFS